MNKQITTYSDYRAFLVAHVHQCKQRNKDWTFGVFAKQLGLKDPSSISKIILGQRHPGEEITSKLINYFKFSENEANYFRDLIRLRKIKNDPRLTILLLEKMGRDNPNISLRILPDNTFKIISKWYCVAIREMFKLDQFLADPEWISKALEFKVTPTEASKAIELLLEVGLLERMGGELVIKDANYHTTNDLSSEAIKQYHESMLDIAKLAIRKFDVEMREFTAQTLTIKADRIDEAKELIRNFKNKFTELLSEEGGDLTTQIQIQFFPLTKQTHSNTSPGGLQ